MNTYDILSIGTCYLDLVLTDFPFADGMKPETEVVGSDYAFVPGGSALIFARVAGAIGLNPLFVGKTGKDLSADMLDRLLEQEGVTAKFVRSDDVLTNVGPQFVSPEGKTIMAVAGTANQSLSADDVLETVREQVPHVKAVYLGGVFKLTHLLPAYKEMVRLAKEHNVMICLDHGRVTNKTTDEARQLVSDSMSNVDVYMPSEDEFFEVWGAQLGVASSEEPTDDEFRAALAAFSERFPNVRVMLKVGSRGAYGSHGSELLHVPAHTVVLKNTSGAGDSCNAGLISGLLSGRSFEDALKKGVATAAAMIETDGLPEQARIKEFLSA